MSHTPNYNMILSEISLNSVERMQNIHQPTYDCIAMVIQANFPVRTVVSKRSLDIVFCRCLIYSYLGMSSFK